MRFPLFTRQPRWPALQIEVSSTCGANCAYCPRSALNHAWEERLLPLEQFRALTPAMARARHVHLQGWGEPLRHPDLEAMITLAAGQGCLVSTTTCGLGLSEARIEALIRAGLHIIALSVAGGEAAHDALRPATPHAAVLTALERIQRVRKRLGSMLPHVHLAWLATVSNADDVRLLPAMMQAYGIREATVSGISLAVSPAMERECFAALAPEHFAEAMHPMTALLDAAFEAGLSVQVRVPVPSGYGGMDTAPLRCPEPVNASPFITARGEVTSCILGCLPVHADGPENLEQHWYAGAPVPLPHSRFGLLADAPLDAIWESETYSSFRKEARAGRLPSHCDHCHMRQVRPLSGTLRPPGDSMTERLAFLRACRQA